MPLCPLHMYRDNTFRSTYFFSTKNYPMPFVNVCLQFFCWSCSVHRLFFFFKLKVSFVWGRRLSLASAIAHPYRDKDDVVDPAYVSAPNPYLGMFFKASIIGMFSYRGYFVLLGFVVIFELLNQVISPCPKTYRSLRYEYEYQHCIKNPNTVLLVRTTSPEMQWQFRC